MSGGEGQKERERGKRIPHPAGGLRLGLFPGPRDYDLS